MIERSYENRSWWFVLLGDRIVAMIAMLSLAPAIYAIWLVHQSRYWGAAALGVAWFVSDSIFLIALHHRRVVRLKDLNLSSARLVQQPGGKQCVGRDETELVAEWVRAIKTSLAPG